MNGEIADFNELYCTQPAPDEENSGWASTTKPRCLTERFLLDILAKPQFSTSVPHRGVRIIGAYFDAGVDLSTIHFERPLWLDRTRFAGELSLESAKLDRWISFDGSTFAAKLEMNGIEIGNGLALRDGATFRGDVSLVGAKVGGYLNASGATFAAGLDMDSLEVGKSLFLRGGATFKGDVNLLSARVGGSLDAGGATFAGALGMEDIEVARNLYLRNGAAFEGGIYASSARVGADIALNNASSGADVDLTNAKAGGDLRLGSSTHERARWGSNARLLLRNAGFGAVQDRLDTEPDGSRLDAWPGRAGVRLSSVG